MYSRAELVILARAYLAAQPKKMAPSTLGLLIGVHDKFFDRLFDGGDCTAGGAETVSVWFDLNWPQGILWPCDVQRRGAALNALEASKRLAAAAAAEAAP